MLGAGNVLMRDDGVGVHIVHALERMSWPETVTFVDAGTAVPDSLTYLSDVDHILIVDAVHGDGVPGSVYRIPFDQLPRDGSAAMSLHQLSLVEGVEMMRLAGQHLPPITILGIEPAEVGPSANLSEPLQQKFSSIVDCIRKEILRRLQGRAACDREPVSSTTKGG